MKMNSEYERLQSFQSWSTIAPVNKQRLARGGFYYLGYGLTVQCFSCNLQISEWNYGDIVMSRHKAQSPDCEFVKDPANSGNLPLGCKVSCKNSRLTSRLENDTLVVSSYRTEKARLESFTTWPKTDIIHPSKMVKSGFFFTKTEDKVQCAFCSATFKNWDQAHDPDTVHIRIQPSCSFMISKASTSQLVHIGTEVEETLGVYCNKVPSNLALAYHGDRLNTFTFWQNPFDKNLEDMADAGFYYCGPDDLVKCFHCGVQIDAWEPTDDPWIEHARWAPQCGYVRMSKGRDFINQYNSSTEGPFTSVPKIQEEINPMTMSDHESLRTQPDCDLPKLVDEAKFRQDDQVRLKEDLQKSADAHLCKICMDKEMDILFDPCGHLVTCDDCSKGISVCPICRKEIKRNIKAFLS